MSDDDFTAWWTGPYGQFSRRCEWPLTMTQAAQMAWDTKEEEASALRAEADRLETALNERCDDVARLRVENERLRAALAHVANTINSDGGPYATALQAIDELVTTVRMQARAALGGNDDI